jgi:hypothetical protein
VAHANNVNVRMLKATRTNLRLADLAANVGYVVAAVLLFAPVSTTLLRSQSAGDRTVVDDLSSMKAEFKLPCLVGRHALLEEPGSPVVLGSDELKRRAIRTAMIMVPQGTLFRNR